MVTVAKKVGEGTVWMSVSAILIKVISIAYAIVVLSYLTVFEYGLVELAISIPPMMGLLSLAGLDPVIIADLGTYKRDDDKKSAGKLLSSYILLRFVLSVIASIGLLIVSLYFMDSFSEPVRNMVSILSLSFLMSPFRSLVNLSCNVLHKFWQLSLFSFLEEALKLALVAFFLIKVDLGPVGIIVAYVLSEAIVTILFLPVALGLLKEFRGFYRWSSQPLFALKTHAIWSILQASLHSFSQNLRPWIIQFFLGVPAVGIYGLAFGMFQHVSTLFPLWKVVTPIIPSYSNDRLRLAKLINSTIKYQALILVFNSVAAFIFIPVLINNFFPDYESAYPLFVLMTLALLPGSFSRVFVSAFHALRLQKNLFTSGIFFLGMIVVVLPLTISLFGLYGIAVEFFITLTIYAFGRYRVLKNSVEGYQFSFRDMLTVTETDRLIIDKVWHAVGRKLKY
tara:strand:+ start:1019 stop:2371 length:1353 start_codon:yes stop_codon:yes gene_type:complete